MNPQIVELEKLGEKIDEKLNEINSTIEQLLEQRKRFVDDKKQIEKGIKRLQEIEKERQETLKKEAKRQEKIEKERQESLKREAELKEEAAKLTAKLKSLQDGIKNDEEDKYEVCRGSWVIDLTIDDERLPENLDAALDANATYALDVGLDDVEFMCSITIESDVVKAIDQTSEFLEGIKNKCTTLNRLWNYVQTQLAKLRNNLRDDAIFIIARDGDKK